MISSAWLEAFVVFAESANFTHAARRLHISQPALHVQIQKLSEQVGAVLYARQGRSLELTAAGKKLLAFGREQRERSQAFLSELNPGVGDETVVLAAGEGTLLYLLPPALRAFQRSRHGTLRVLTRDRDHAISAVQLGEAHLAVTPVDEVPPDLAARRLVTVGAAVVMSKQHPLARKRAISVKALDGEPLIVPGQGRPLRVALARAWSEAGNTWSPAVEANGWQVMMALAELGLGVAIVNDFCRPPKGTVLRPLHGLPALQYQLVRRRSGLTSRSAQELEAWLIGAFS